MSKRQPKTPAAIVRLNMNGLRGRMLKMPSKNKADRQLLIIGGQRTSLEYWQPLAEELSRYGHVTMPDLPGFGGMTSFYKSGRQPSLDLMAGYLAAFIKLRYKRKRVTLIGMDFGFVVATRMLQRYPDLHQKIDLVVSYGGIAHWRDLRISRLRRYGQIAWSKWWGRTLPAGFYHNVFLHPWLIQVMLRKQLSRLDKAPPKRESQQLVRQAVRVCHANDVKTHFWSETEQLRLDNCHQNLPLPLVYVKYDEPNINDFELEQHLNVIYQQVSIYQLKLSRLQLAVLMNDGKLTKLMPRALKTRLNKKPTTIAKA